MHWDIILPKPLFHTKPMTSATEEIFIPHPTTAALTPHCASLPIRTMSGTQSMVSPLQRMNELVEEVLDG